jgi:hypothetical protein
MSNDTTFTREPNRPSRRTRANGRSDGRFTDDASWAEIPPEELADFTSRVVASGACCIFSRASDGGVLSLTVIHGNERFRAFPRSGNDAIVAMRDILDELGLR